MLITRSALLFWSENEDLTSRNFMGKPLKLGVFKQGNSLTSDARGGCIRLWRMMVFFRKPE
jgi:hypothetical protein